MFRKTLQCCENLRDSDTPLFISYYGEMKQCVVSIFSLIQIFKEQNFAVNLFRYTLKFSCFFAVRDGGAMRDRTADLLRARQALSQLSYNPIVNANLCTLIRFRARRGGAKHTEVCEHRRNTARRRIW